VKIVAQPKPNVNAIGGLNEGVFRSDRVIALAIIPKGWLTITRRFNAGKNPDSPSSEGTAENLNSRMPTVAPRLGI
jgi:hypothetical protein